MNPQEATPFDCPDPPCVLLSSQVERLAQIARELHALRENAWEVEGGYALSPRDEEKLDAHTCELMQMVEACIGQQEGPRWWQP